MQKARSADGSAAISVASAADRLVGGRAVGVDIWDADDIKALRKRLGLSQQSLAERVGCAVRTITAWEAGAVLPNARHQASLHEIGRARGRVIGSSEELLDQAAEAFGNGT